MTTKSKAKKKPATPQRQNSTKVTVAVSNELRKRMLEANGTFNWSAIAQKAFETAIDEAQGKADTTEAKFEELAAQIARLKKQISKL